MNLSKLFTTVLAAVCVLGLCASAQAMRITNLSTGTVVFHDDFEGVSPVSNAAYPDTSGDYDPDNVSLPGDILTGETNEYGVQVTDYSTPGAAEGAQYLRMIELYSIEDITLSSTQTNSGDIIRWEFMLNMVAGAQTQFYLRKADGTGVVNLITNYKGYAFCNYHATGRGPLTGIPAYTPDVWQHWAIDYAVGANTWTLTIDGDASDPAPTAGSGEVGLAYVRLVNGYPTHIDAVPEPTTAALLTVAGLLGFAFVLRRRQGS